jgi:preprotein translocase subunit SecG
MPEPTSTNPHIASWLNHIRALAVDIGPRGPTREGERQGALYAQAQFEKIGLQSAFETFSSARSIFHPHILGSGLMFLAFILFPVGGRITAILAALLSIFVLVCELLELSFQNNPFRKIVPKGESQNVFAVIPPAGEHQRDLILVGHLDSQRTPIIFSTRRWVKVYDRFTMITFACFIVQAIVYSLAIFLQISWAWYASIPAALCAILLAAMCIQAEATPFTAGANDNASAVGMVLTLAEEFTSHPLQNTRVFAVCTGCEEVQHYGMIDFYKRHLQELKNPTALVFEMLGCASPAWLTKEGIIVPFKADQRMVKIAESLSAEHPEWDAHPAVISGGNTEMADALRCKIPAITISGITRDGAFPFWHQLADTFDKMDPIEMEKAWNMTGAMIKRLDNESKNI